MTNKTPTQFIKHLDIPTEKKKLNKASKIFKISFLFFVICLSLLGILSIFKFIDEHTFRNPIIIRFQSPIINKDMVSPVGSKSAYLIPQAEAEEPTLEEYVISKFGKHGQIALAVFKAESGLREDAYNVNTNGSIDVGVAQINSVHFTKEGCSLKELIEWKKNVNCAYQIFEASGFNAWTAFKNQSYVNKL